MVFFVELVRQRRANKHTEEGGPIKVQWQSPQLYRQSFYPCTSTIATPFKCHSNKTSQYKHTVHVFKH